MTTQPSDATETPSPPPLETEAAQQAREEIYARRVVVPVSNPRTAPQLIRFAASVADPEKGKIKALFVNTPDFPYKDAREKLEQAIELLRSQDVPVELITVSAHTVQRGVLDVTREENADLLVLGFQSPNSGEVAFGAITESVVRVVPTDLIVYRHVPERDLKRVIVPVTDIKGTQRALLHAVHVAQHQGDIPVVALHVQSESPTPFWRENSPAPVWQQMALLESAIYDEAHRDAIQTKVVKALDLVTGVVQEATIDDLIMLSTNRAQANVNDRWLFGVTAQKMLRLVPGPLAIIKRHAELDKTFWERAQNYLSRWTPTLTLGERTDVVEQAGDLVRTNTNYVVMMILSSILASIGLLQNSGAVIIGAMLVAPLMSPLMGFGIGLAIGETQLLRKSSLTVMQGIAMVLGVAVLVGLVSAFPTATPEMLSRGAPTLLDMFVALASGIAGSFALARRDIPAALAGVAIAAALVPPICTTGLALAAGNYPLFMGSGILSVVNVIGISLASAGTFAVIGVRREDGIPIWQRVAVSLLVLVVLSIPLGIFLSNATQRDQLAHHTQLVIEAQLATYDVEVMDIEIDGDRVTVTLRSRQEVAASQVRDIEAAVEERMERDIELEFVVLRLLP